jgi:hypothetical protein
VRNRSIDDLDDEEGFVVDAAVACDLLVVSDVIFEGVLLDEALPLAVVETMKEEIQIDEYSSKSWWLEQKVLNNTVESNTVVIHDDGGCRVTGLHHHPGCHAFCQKQLRRNTRRQC